MAQANPSDQRFDMHSIGDYFSFFMSVVIVSIVVRGIKQVIAY